MEVIKQVIKSVINFLEILITEYTVLTILGLLIIIGLIAWCSITALNKAKKRKIKEQQEYKKTVIQSLTEEEINKISKNSANPEAAKEHLTQEAHITPSKPINSAPKTNDITTEEVPASKPEEVYTPSVKGVPKVSIEIKSKPIETETAVTQTKPAVKKEVKPNESKATKPQTKKAEQPKKSVKKEEPAVKLSPKLEVKISKPTATATTKNKTVKNAEPTPQPVEDKKRIYSGKWKIVREADGFYAVLIASNGGTLLQTELYRSLSSVKSGIETIKKNIDGGNFAISVDKYGHYRFKLFNRTNRLICVSEDYSSKSKCESGIESVKRFAKTETVIFEDN